MGRVVDRENSHDRVRVSLSPTRVIRVVLVVDSGHAAQFIVVSTREALLGRFAGLAAKNRHFPDLWRLVGSLRQVVPEPLGR